MRLRRASLIFASCFGDFSSNIVLGMNFIVAVHSQNKSLGLFKAISQLYFSLIHFRRKVWEKKNVDIKTVFYNFSNVEVT